MMDSSYAVKNVLPDEPLPQTQRYEAMGRVTAAVAHDFNNLLTIIGGYADVGQIGCDDASKECFVEIASAGRKASELIRQLLTFAGHHEPSAALVDLNDAVGSLSPLMRRVIPAGIELRLELSPEPVPVFVDPAQLEQVLLNLVLNSRDAIDGNGSITVTTMTDELSGVVDDVSACSGCVRVTDTGAGIPEDVRPHIFDPFFTTKSSHLGTGLGLATIHGIVTQSAGAIFVDSIPGVGTTMTVAFPAERPARILLDVAS